MLCRGSSPIKSMVNYLVAFQYNRIQRVNSMCDELKTPEVLMAGLLATCAYSK